MRKPQIEFESPKNIKTFQEKKLVELIDYLNQNSVFYQRLFRENKINPNDIKTIADLRQLPFTTKDDLTVHNEDFLCVPKNKVADFITTSGTIGDPITFYLTTKDLERLAYNEAISLQCAGGDENEIYQLMTTIDKRFMAGLAYFLGAQKLGAGIVRVGPGAAFLQWDSIKRCSPTTLIAIPSFIPKLIQYAIDHGIDYNNSSVKSIVCIGEPLRTADFELNELGKRITSLWDVQLFSTYASTEMSAAFTECEHGLGGHHHPELLVLEVVDENGQQVEDGEMGEVVVSTLDVEGMPLLRYKTGDLCHVHYSSCPCGRHTTRLGPIVGRKQQMLKFKGTTIYPPAIFNIMDSMTAIDLYQVEISKNEFGYDDINIFIAEDVKSEKLENELSSLFKSKLRVTPTFKFISKRALTDKIFDQNKRKPDKLIYV